MTTGKGKLYKIRYKKGNNPLMETLINKPQLTRKTLKDIRKKTRADRN